MPSGAPRESWLDRLGLNRPELRAWAMYDWANSAFWTTVIAVVFPQYFARVLAADLPAGQATSYFAWTSALAVAVVAAIAPVLGAIADYAALKKRMLAFFIGIGVVSTACLWFVERGDWQWGLFLFVMGNIGAAGSITFSDSLLPHIAAPHEVDRVSSSAYAIGYLGGGLLLVINAALDREARVARHARRHVPGPALVPERGRVVARVLGADPAARRRAACAPRGR